jgi:class 3 adenylate cyclase
VTADPGSHRTADEREKEILRLARRIRRLEGNMEELEQLRDHNARLMDQLMGELSEERRRSEALLLNVLPQRIVDRLHAGETLIADRHGDVAVVFSDFVGFTAIAGALPAPELVAELNALFSAFDAACATHEVEKIKTIGDAYMAVAGLGDVANDPVVPAARLALDMQAAVAAAGDRWHVRIGVASGPVVAGVIGTRKFAYDVWGDTVNLASRLESTAPADAIHVSAGVASRLGSEFALVPRGEVDLKGKGPTSTFLLVGHRDG